MSVVVSAQAYKCQDANGKTTYQSQPCHGDTKGKMVVDRKSQNAILHESHNHAIAQERKRAREMQIRRREAEQQAIMEQTRMQAALQQEQQAQQPAQPAKKQLTKYEQEMRIHNAISQVERMNLPKKERAAMLRAILGQDAPNEPSKPERSNAPPVPTPAAPAPSVITNCNGGFCYDNMGNAYHNNGNGFFSGTNGTNCFQMGATMQCN